MLLIPTDTKTVIKLLPHLPRADKAPANADVVYIIQACSGGPVKIGHSTRQGVERRVQALQVGNHEQLVVRALFLGDSWLEKALHDFFAEHRLQGEWFALNDVLLKLAPEIVSDGDVSTFRRGTVGLDGYAGDFHGGT